MVTAPENLLKYSLGTRGDTVLRLTDDQLVRHCVQHRDDEEAWGEFRRRFLPTLIRAARRGLGGADAAPAVIPASRWQQIDDCVAEVLLKLVEQDCRVLREFKGRHAYSIHAYLATITRHHLWDKYRRREAQKRYGKEISLHTPASGGGDSQVPSLPMDETLPDPDPDPEGRLYGRDLVRRLLQVAESVVRGHERDRNLLIFQLFIEEGLTPAEISAIDGLGVTQRNIEGIISRIKGLIRARDPDLFRELGGLRTDSHGNNTENS